MPDVSKIRLPDNSEVNIKDSRIVGVDTAPTSGSSNVVTSGGVFDSLRMDNIRPLETHTYSNVLTNSTYVTSGYILFQVKPIVWDEPVLVRYRMKIYVDGHEDLYYSKNECVFALFHDTVSAYSCKNYIGSTSYRTIYYHSVYRCKAGYSNIGHLFGFCYYNAGTSYSRNCTTSGYGRTFVVEILETDNCTITWPDSCVLATGISGYVADTSHFARSDYIGYGQGEAHTGDANTNTVGYCIRTGTATKKMQFALYRYRICFSSQDGSKWIPADTSTSTNATALRDVNQTPINPFGEIAYYYTTAVVNADVAPAAGNMWRQYELTLGYSFNRTGAALVLTYPAPVYVKCAPQSDGSAIIDANTPYVQSLPSTADGKIYIFLGMAYNATAINLLFDHPIYYHDGTGIRIWTGKEITESVAITNSEIDTIMAL